MEFIDGAEFIRRVIAAEPGRKIRFNDGEFRKYRRTFAPADSMKGPSDKRRVLWSSEKVDDVVRWRAPKSNVVGWAGRSKRIELLEFYDASNVDAETTRSKIWAAYAEFGAKADPYVTSLLVSKSNDGASMELLFRMTPQASSSNPVERHIYEQAVMKIVDREYEAEFPSKIDEFANIEDEPVRRAIPMPPLASIVSKLLPALESVKTFDAETLDECRRIVATGLRICFGLSEDATIDDPLWPSFAPWLPLFRSPRIRDTLLEYVAPFAIAWLAYYPSSRASWKFALREPMRLGYDRPMLEA